MLKGHRILVTGASRGIGRAIALGAAREGAAVGAGYLRAEAEAESLRAEVEAAGGRIRLLRFDVADSAAVKAAIDGFAWAEGGLDALVAGAAVPVPGLLAALPDEEIRRATDVNLLGPLFCARAAIPHFLANRSGLLLLVSSVAAVRPGRGQTVYAATKGGVEALARAFAVEYGRKGLRAICLRPGPVTTRMTEGARHLAGEEVLAHVPLGRFASPEEIAEVALFLLSERAAFVNGAVVPVDGGYEIG